MAKQSYGELRRDLEAIGCELRAQGKGSHEKWYSPLTDLTFIVPNPLKGTGTEKAIRRDSGLASFDAMPPKLRKRAMKDARATARTQQAATPAPPLPHRQNAAAPVPGAARARPAPPSAGRPH